MDRSGIKSENAFYIGRKNIRRENIGREYIGREKTGSETAQTPLCLNVQDLDVQVDARELDAVLLDEAGAIAAIGFDGAAAAACEQVGKWMRSIHALGIDTCAGANARDFTALRRLLPGLIRRFECIAVTPVAMPAIGHILAPAYRDWQSRICTTADLHANNLNK